MPVASTVGSSTAVASGPLRRKHHAEVAVHRTKDSNAAEGRVNDLDVRPRRDCVRSNKGLASKASAAIVWSSRILEAHTEDSDRNTDQDKNADADLLRVLVIHDMVPPVRAAIDVGPILLVVLSLCGRHGAATRGGKRRDNGVGSRMTGSATRSNIGWYGWYWAHGVWIDMLLS